MVNENIIPKTETIYELKNEYKVPSFEEFMQSYENDSNLNYADLNSGDISEAKGYGPTNVQIAGVVESFNLRVECYNWGGGGGTYCVNSTDEALWWAEQLEKRNYINVSHEVELQCSILIRQAVAYYKAGNEVDGYVRVQGRFWGGYERKWKY